MLLYSYSAGASSWSVGRPASRGDYIPILLLRLLYLVHCRKVESSSETGELALNYPLSKDQFVIHSLWRMAVPLLESNQYNLFRKDLLCNKLFETGSTFAEHLFIRIFKALPQYTLCLSLPKVYFIWGNVQNISWALSSCFKLHFGSVKKS